MEVMDPHPSIGREELVPQMRFSILSLYQDEQDAAIVTILYISNLYANIFHSSDFYMWNIFNST